MNEEIIQLCDSDGVPQGNALRSVCHKDPSMIQMVVHLLIFNSKGEIFLQKRSDTKDVYPGMWDTAVGGHVSAGEDIYTSLVRESKEELGIDLKNAEFIFKQLNKSETETELSFVYKTIYDGPFRIDKNEVTDGRFFTIKEIKEKLGKNIFTPNFEKEFKRLFF
ncbi:MAG: NUDIX domain-containing protein [Spirochaetes bacterium]|nr:NUDIX domain-containing protein [Spirochaetota bacterium]